MGPDRFEPSEALVRCSVPDAPVEGAGSVSLGPSVYLAPSAWVEGGVLSFGTHGTKDTSASVWLSGHLFEVEWEPDPAGGLRCTSVEFREAQVVTGVLRNAHPGSVLVTAGECRAREKVLDPSGAFYVELEGEGPCWLQAFTPPDLLGDVVAVGDGAEEEVVLTLPADRETVYWGWMPAQASIGRPGRMDLVIAEVTPGSPAAMAGFQVGDEITAVGGTPVAALHDSQLGAWMSGTRGEVFLVELRGPDGGVREVELRVE